MRPIPVYDPLPEVEALWEELQAATLRVLHPRRYILRPEEEATCGACGRRYRQAAPERVEKVG